MFSSPINTVQQCIYASSSLLYGIGRTQLVIQQEWNFKIIDIGFGTRAHHILRVFHYRLHVTECRGIPIIHYVCS